MERVIISTENVTPSSPTPHHLKTYKLSMLDQTVPPMLVPLVLYFPNTTTDQQTLSPSQKTHLLKRSLSLILTRFYPLAGRIKGDALSIDCNDEGVPFVVSEIKGQKLSDVLTKPDQDLPGRLLPCKVSWDAELGPGDCVSMIQINHFDCGGIAIGLVLWHKTADAATIGNFVDSWAATTIMSGKPVSPNYVSQSLFPQKQEIQIRDASFRSLLKGGKSSMKRYVFDACAISTLKAKIETRSSKVEVVSALIWKCFMVASIANKKSTSLLTQAVNLRRRAQPPFSSDCFGNFTGVVAAYSNNNIEKDMKLGHLVEKMRGAISKIDGDYVSSMQGEEGASGYYANLKRIWSDIPEGCDLLSISSWCNFGLYGVDFGWGKPVWLTRCDTGSDLDSSQFMNIVGLMDTKNGDGVEAWVILEESYMSTFDSVEELQTLASIDPSPLDFNESHSTFKGV